jgi:hypothetical protein
MPRLIDWPSATTVMVSRTVMVESACTQISLSKLTMRSRAAAPPAKPNSKATAINAAAHLHTVERTTGM